MQSSLNTVQREVTYCWLVFLRGVEVLFGYQVNTLCLGSCSMLIPACTCIAKLDACKTIFQTGNFYLLTCVLKHLDAHRRPFRLRWVPWTAGSHALMLVGQCRVGWEESSPASEPWAPAQPARGHGWTAILPAGASVLVLLQLQGTASRGSLCLVLLPLELCIHSPEHQACGKV